MEFKLNCYENSPNNCSNSLNYFRQTVCEKNRSCLIYSVTKFIPSLRFFAFTECSVPVSPTLLHITVQTSQLERNKYFETNSKSFERFHYSYKKFGNVRKIKN